MKRQASIRSMRTIRKAKGHARNEMMQQAMADDAQTNNGWMFGNNATRFFTSGGQYHESWECVSATKTVAFLRRIPTHPMQSVSYYRYEASKEFGGMHDRANFRWIDKSEVGEVAPAEDCA